MKNIVLMGDSITEYLPYALDKNMKRGFNVPMVSEKLPDSDLVFYICGASNLGIGTFHNYYWKSVKKENVDCFVLLIGINNILRPDCDYDDKLTLDNTVEKLKTFIDDITREKKDLLVELLYPTDNSQINNQVLYVNNKLRKFCEEKSIDYLDLYEILSTDSNVINPQYSDDGLHPNQTGYKVILNEISKKLQSKKDKPKRLCKQG